MNKKSYTNEFVNECKEEFDSALNNDFNIPVALTAFYKLIREINSLAADEKITCDVSSIILPELERMMDILGINIVKISDDEKDEINHLIEKRNVYRNEKNFDEADKIREQIAEKNIKIAGQPKLDLKSHGEGKDLNYTLEIDELPKIKIKSMENIKFIDYEINVTEDETKKRISEIEQNLLFSLVREYSSLSLI